MSARVIPREGVESQTSSYQLTPEGVGRVIPREGVESTDNFAGRLEFIQVIPREGVERTISHGLLEFK